MFLTEDHIMIFAEGTFCFDCEHPWRLLFMKYDYQGNLLDSTLYPLEDDENYFINGYNYFYGTFENEDDEYVAILRYLNVEDGNQFYHHSLYHFDEDFNILDNDTLWDFSIESEMKYRVDNETQLGGSYIIGGHTLPASSSDINDVFAYIAAIDPETGESLWYKEYPDLFDIHKVYNFNDGFIWALGGKRIWNPEFDFQYVLLKMDQEGNILKSIDFGGEGGEGEFRTVHMIKEEDRILIGGLIANDTILDENTGSDRGPYTTIVFNETDSGFEEAQKKTYGVKYNYQQVNGFFPVEDDSTYMLFGHYRTSTTPWQQGYLLNLSYEMDSLWSRKYIYYDSQEADHFIRYLKPAPDGGYIGCGYVDNSFFDPFPGIEQLWLFRTDEYGCLEPGCQDVNVEEITIGLENVMSVYPNPARDRVTVEFDFPKNYSPPNSGEFRLMSTDGREVLRKEVDASTFSSSMQLDVSSLQSGVYILHWTDGKRWFDSVKILKN
jgi:hypothetical protein